MKVKVSALAVEKIMTVAREKDRDFICPDLVHTFMWDKHTGRLTATDERSFNEIEQAIVDYYENRLRRIQDIHNIKL